MAERMPKVNELLRQELGNLINAEVEFPLGTIVTITQVSTSPDLRHSGVYVSIIPADREREAMSALIRETKNLQALLNKRVFLRSIPKLRFYIDKEEQKAAEIDYLLDNLK